MKDVATVNISNEVIKPIVDIHIKNAVIEAIGNKEAIIEQFVQEVFNKKVDHSGKVSNYSGDNKFSWFDVIVTNQIKECIKNEMQEQIIGISKEIKEALINQIKTKKGSNAIASAMIAGLEGTLKNAWTSRIDIKFNQKDN